jgi:hypothetical protein
VDSAVDAVLSHLEAVADEIAAEKVVKASLSDAFAVDPQAVTQHLATAALRRPVAAYALWQLAPEQALRTVGPDVAAAALIRFHQPQVPGWWDGWAATAMAWAVEEWPVATVMPYLDLCIEWAPSESVLAWVGCGPLCDALAWRRDEFYELFSDRASRDRRWRIALDAADPVDG